MNYTLTELPYAYDYLEPHIDEETMHIHHDKHHQAYVNNLNAAIEKHPELFKKTAEELLHDLSALPADIATAVRNNAGGHVNHTFFWDSMTNEKNSILTGEIETRLIESFGSVDNFKEEFEKAATTRFGSGWAWLVENNGKLEVVSTANQDSPLSDEKTPLLGLDVWEHAYYLRYQNVRPNYIKAFWNVVNWEAVNKRLKRK